MLNLKVPVEQLTDAKLIDEQIIVHNYLFRMLHVPRQSTKDKWYGSFDPIVVYIRHREIEREIKARGFQPACMTWLQTRILVAWRRTNQLGFGMYYSNEGNRVYNVEQRINQRSADYNERAEQLYDKYRLKSRIEEVPQQ